MQREHLTRIYRVSSLTQEKYNRVLLLLHSAEPMLTDTILLKKLKRKGQQLYFVKVSR